MRDLEYAGGERNGSSAAEPLTALECEVLFETSPKAVTCMREDLPLEQDFRRIEAKALRKVHRRWSFLGHMPSQFESIQHYRAWLKLRG